MIQIIWMIDIMLEYLKAIYRILLICNDYKPQKVSLYSFYQWLNQFPAREHVAILRLFNSLIYFNEKETKKILFNLNKELTEFIFENSEIGYPNIIYATFSSPGSSSHVMLNILRDTANLERKKAKFIDITNAEILSYVTNKLGEGLIVYVDDFAGSGKQFERNRNFAAEFIQGNFSEYFLAPVICSEAEEKFNEMGVTPVVNKIHGIIERPLHKANNILSESEKKKLINICKRINKKNGLGFKKMAAMIIFYRNSPNNVPLLFRGSLKQSPFKGIFPRADDLNF